LIRPSRRAALFSFLLSAGLLALSAAGLLAGDYSIFTLMVVFLAFYFMDTALTRLHALSKAPRQLGFSPEGLHLRTPRGEDSIAWAGVRDVRGATAGGRVDVLRVELLGGGTKVFRAVPQALALEAKLAWLEAAASRRPPAARAMVATAASALQQAGFPEDLEPTAAPQYWSPVDAAAKFGLAEAPVAGVRVVDSAPESEEWKQAAGRPEWSFTRVAGVSQADPRYPAQPAAVPAFTWHFIPPSGTHVGGVFLVAVLILAGIAISRLAADVLLSVAGLPSDPWTATGVGLGLGLALAVAVWQMARDELAGEVAGSVIFLPSFDRTKAEILSSIRDAGAALGAGQPRERRRRARAILVWPQVRTRATVLQSSYDTRAIVLKTVGRPNYDLHAALKAAILERLRPLPRRK
jgi:hypothetical protein